MGKIPDTLRPLYQKLSWSVEFYPLRLQCCKTWDGTLDYLSVSLVNRPDFNKALNLYPDGTEPQNCFVEEVPIMAGNPHTGTANGKKEPPRLRVTTPLEIEKIKAYVETFFEVETPFISRVRGELRDLIKDANIVITPINNDTEATIRYPRRKIGYITARPDLSNPEAIWVNPQPKTSGALGYGKRESSIPWPVLAQFVQNELIFDRPPPDAK